MTALADSTGVTSDRFGFTLFLSVCMHAVLILGVGFGFYEQFRRANTLDITIAQYRSETAPEEADFLAQENQRGSGSEEEKAAPSSPFEAPFTDDSIQEVNAEQQQATRQQASESSQQVITTASASSQDASTIQSPDNPRTELPDSPQNRTQEELSQSLASLQAQLDMQRQAYAKRPRRYTISSASTRRSFDAAYLDAWRKRIELVGNQNYPEIASAQGLYGNLRLLVALKPDGSVESIRILRSSGHAVLDQAAIRIVNLSAPFAPFPPEIRSEVDILEIIRTWQFRQGDTFSSY